MLVDAPFPHRSLLGEGPRWEGDRLLYVDGLAGEVSRLDPATGERTTVQAGPPVGFAVSGRAGECLVGHRDTLDVVATDGRVRATLATVEPDQPASRINDGECDPAGRVVFGTLVGEELDRAPIGALYRLGPEGLRTLVTGVHLSNGIGFDAARERMYHVDSWTWRVDVVDYAAGSGEVGDRRPFAVIDRADGMPDGLTVDAEGGVWVALFGGGRVRRYDPDGRPSLELEVPVTLPTSVAFGGPDLRTLFITTAAHRLTPAQRAAETLAGAVLVAEPGVAGVPVTTPWFATAHP